MRAKSWDWIINKPYLLCLMAFGTVILNCIRDRFGTFSAYGGSRATELYGLVIPLAILILPIFIKKLRKTYWSKSSVAISLITVILSVILICIIYANKEYYFNYWYGVWLDERYRTDAPPIRWDIWNIIDKQYPE